MRLSLLLLAVGLLVPPAPAASEAMAPPAPRWVATWGTSAAPLLRTPEERTSEGLVFENETLRQALRVSLGGRAIRLTLSNLYGVAPVTFAAVHVARRAQEAAILPGSDRVVTFGGRTRVTLPPNATMLSDPVRLDVPDDSELLVSLHVAEAAMAAGIHYDVLEAVYAAPGDQTAAENLPEGRRKVSAWVYLAEVAVLAPAQASAIVAVGDSITDGSCSTFDANQRWTDRLVARLKENQATTPRGVVDAGISGNCLLSDPGRWVSAGVNALARFDRDALLPAGVGTVIVLEGTNDIGTSEKIDPTLVDQLAGALRQLAAKAHARGVRIYCGTLLPFGGAGYANAEKEKQRLALNRWIRASDCFDGIIDFEAAVRDPAQPDRFTPAYDSGDHLHPNDAGYQAMADCIDLTLFR